jgi:hypothetical protein
MTTPLPDPLVPAHVDLRDFQFMALDVARLRDSELVSVPDAEAFRCNVLSWCVAWHQTPAGSLPDDDVALARLMGYGRDVDGWKCARHLGGLRGWVKCSDGRLYHPVVSTKAVEAWGHKQRAKKKRERDAERLRIWREKQGHEDAADGFETGDETHDVAATSQRGRSGVAERSDRTGPDRTGSNRTGPLTPPPSPCFTVGDDEPSHAAPSPNAQPATVDAGNGLGSTIAQREVVGGRKTPAAVLGHRANALDTDALKRAVEARDPMAVVAVFHVTPGHDEEWLNATDQMQVGEVAAVLTWRRYRKDPVRMPSGFRDALTAWRTHSMQSRRDMAASLLGTLGIAVDVTPRTDDEDGMAGARVAR